jgi:hypothetical protein
MSYEELLDRITVDPGVCGGKPCVRGCSIVIVTATLVPPIAGVLVRGNLNASRRMATNHRT